MDTTRYLLAQNPMDDKELDAEIERLKKVSTSLRESMETLQKGLDGTKKSKEQLVKLGKAAEAQAKSYQNLSHELDSLRDQVKNETDAKKKSILEERRQALELQNQREKAEENFRQGLGKMTGSVLAGITNTFLGGVKSAMGGSDGLTVAAEFMKGGFDVANTAAQAGSQALKDFGSSTAGAGGKIGKFGVAASIAGTAISMLSSGVTELAKAGIGFMLQQTQKLMADFVNLGQAGVVFSGGMTAMASTALKGGMTLDQFSKVVTANRAELTSLGMSMGDASKRMASAMAAGGTSMRKGLFALGMTVEEQADTVAKTMAIMSGPAQRLKANDAEVAKQTEDYAKNLKLLAALTGEDMKAKQDAIRKENDTLAFQQKLDEMGEKERLELQKAMEGMTESQRRALRENMIYGTVISKDIAISQATNSGVAKTNQEFAEAQRNGVLTAQKTLEIQGRNADETYKQAMGNKALAAAAMAGNQAASDAAKSQLADAQYQKKLGKEAVKAEQDKIDAQVAAGKQGKDTGANLMEINQQFAVSLQQIALKNLPAFAKAVQQTINDINKAVAAVVDMSAKAAGMPAWLAPLIGIGTALLQLLPLLIARGGAGTAGTVAGGAASKAAGTLGGAGGAAGGAGGAAGGGGGGAGGFLQGLAKGVSAFATPQAALGLGAVTLAIMGLAKAFEIASPGFEKFGTMLATVMTAAFDGIGKIIPPIAAAVGSAVTVFGDVLVKVAKGIGETVLTVLDGLTNNIIKLGNSADPVKLLGIAGSITALGAAFIPFGVGGALAGLFAKGGGFNQILSDLTAFASLDPVRLAQVADATKKITDSLPSATQMVALAATGYLSKLAGGTPSGAGGNAPAAAAPSSSGSASTPSPSSAASASAAGGNDVLSVMKEVRDTARSQLSILERTVKAAEDTLAVNKKILSASH